MMNIIDFGAIGNGTADDTAAIQAAINTGHKIFWPDNHIYKITSSLTSYCAGQQFYSENQMNTLITTPSGSTFDILRLAHSDCQVEGLFFRPGGTNACIRAYSASMNIKRNRFFAASNNAGKAIILSDTDPVSGSYGGGAYTHVIEQNQIGYSGYAFATAISCEASHYGIQATKFLNNKVTGDKFMDVPYGGGNKYDGNLFQSSTGTSGTPAGDCIYMGVSAAGEMISGNYFENYANCVKSIIPTNTYKVFDFGPNEVESCTNIYSVVSGVTNFVAPGSSYTPPSPSPSGTYSKLTGTTVGDMTSGGGLAVAVDGNTTQGWTASARNASGNAGSIGLTFGSSKTVTRAKIWFSSDYGADSTSSTGINITAAVKGWNGSSWVTLYTTTFADTNNTHALDATSITSGSYSEVRWFISNDNAGSNPPVVAEFEFYETV